MEKELETSEVSAEECAIQPRSDAPLTNVSHIQPAVDKQTREVGSTVHLPVEAFL